MQYIHIATEDEVSEAVAIRLIEEAGLLSNHCFPKKGNGYLKQQIKKFCEIAKQDLILLLTDLDNGKCPSFLIKNWLGGNETPKKLIFRIVVREIEAWLLADHEAIKSLLGNKIGKLPETPDTLDNPKETLLRFAAKAPRKIRDDLIVQKGSQASQGLGYNTILSDFVRNSWSPKQAANRSDSLRRARLHIKQLVKSTQNKEKRQNTWKRA